MNDVNSNLGKISIILPVYNAEKYLKETLNSLFDQTYQNFEIIAVNDGSTDKSLEILTSFRDERLKVIDKENSGVSETRNIAIQNATGEYLSFLDADDYYSPNYLERLISVAEENGADMVVCNYTPFRGAPSFDVKLSEAVFVQNTNILIQAGVITSACTKLIKKSIITEFNIIFDKNMTFGEDLFFCWKALLASKKVYFIDEKLYGYRMTDSGATSKFHPNLYEKYKSAFEDLKAFGKFIGKDDEYAMDVFFTTRIPSFVRMIIREKSTLKKKKEGINSLLDDKIIQFQFYQNWGNFSKLINVHEIKFYWKAKKRLVTNLLLVAYKNEIKLRIKLLLTKAIANFSRLFN